MKRFLLPLLLLLFFPSGALAAKPIPPLKETVAYKNLRTYVLGLEKISSATPEEKASYTATLTARVQAAEAEVLRLFDRRETRTNKNYKSLLEKRYGEVDRRAAKRLSSARKKNSRESRQALLRYRDQRSSIQATYSRKMKPLRTRVAALERQIENSNDPREQALLQEEINLLQGKINRIEAIMKTELREASEVYERDLRRLRAALRRKTAAIKEQKDLERREALRVWRGEKKDALASLRNKRRIENTLVRELRVRGEEAIDAMSAPE